MTGLHALSKSSSRQKSWRCIRHPHCDHLSAHLCHAAACALILARHAVLGGVRVAAAVEDGLHVRGHAGCEGHACSSDSKRGLRHAQDEEKWEP